MQKLRKSCSYTTKSGRIEETSTEARLGKRGTVTTPGDAPIKVQQDRKKLMEGHFNISITKRVSLKNSTDLGRGAAPELKSVEFLSETLLVVEQIDIHTNFTARQMLYLYRSITHIRPWECPPPLPALLTQDSMYPGTATYGRGNLGRRFGCAFSVLSGEGTHGGHGLV